MRTMILIALGVLMCAPASFGQQTPPLYVPYTQPPAPQQYAQPVPQPVRPPAAQTVPQQTSMYDRSYAGPMNVYGQPVFSMNQRAAQQAPQQPQTIHNGFIPKAARGLYGLGTYLWGYMPAPIRGAESPYEVAPGSGHVSVNFVPPASQ